MLVETLKHGILVFDHFRRLWDKTGRRYMAIDTETRAIKPYPKDDALTISRSTIRIWSVCYQGASYSFPTADFHSQFPTMKQWADLLYPLFVSEDIILVAHNWNYDANVFFYDAGLQMPSKFWDTMIGCWAATEYQPKGLKERAPLLGRFLRETKTVDFSNKLELAEYAEQDVVATEEFYQVQNYGIVNRPSVIRSVAPKGNLVVQENPFYQKPFTPENQNLSPFSQSWVKYLEFPVLRATIRAEQRGFPFDLPYLRKIRVDVLKEKRAALKAMFQMAKTRFNPNATRDLARVVELLGIDYPFKTQKGAPSFTAANLAKVEDSHPFFRQLGAYKTLEKLTSVYVGTQPCSNGYNNDCGLERWINPDTGAIHATAGTIEAVTGRGSSSRPNLQQIPARKDKFKVRAAFTGTPKGLVLAPKYNLRRVLCVLDYSQLELRVMALLSRDKAMTKTLCDPKGDIHNLTSTRFGVTRDAAKQLNFLLLYGGQEYMLARELSRMGVPTDEATAAQYKMKHWEVYPRVKAQREEWCEEHQRNGCVRLFFGRTRTLPDADWSNEYTKHKAETRIANNVVQGTGQDSLKASITRSDFQCVNPDLEFPKRVNLPRQHRLYLAERAKELEKLRRILRIGDCRFILQVHDEVIYRASPEAAEECCTILANIMTWFHYFPGLRPYTVPLVAEGGIGDNWKDAKSKEAKFHVSAGFDHFHKYAH